MSEASTPTFGEMIEAHTQDRSQCWWENLYPDAVLSFERRVGRKPNAFELKWEMFHEWDAPVREEWAQEYLDSLDA